MKRQFNLQLFAAPVQGKRIIYKFRRYSQRVTDDAWALAYVTENERTLSVDADSTITKDGPVRTPSAPEQEITATCLLRTGDARIDEIEDAALNNELFEIWEANLDEPVNDTYVQTSDSALVTGKTYYTRSGSGTTESPYTYTEVASPSVSSISTYYELTSSNKFKGKYWQGYCTECNRTSNAEDTAEISLTFGLNGLGARGSVTITAAEQSEASYVFADTPRTGA